MTRKELNGSVSVAYLRLPDHDTSFTGAILAPKRTRLPGLILPLGQDESVDEIWYPADFKGNIELEAL